MPLYEYQCLGTEQAPEGHIREHYFPLAQMAPALKSCATCGAEAIRQPALAVPLQYFSESRGRIIENLDRGRVLHSHGQHKALMQARGVEDATTWHVNRYKQTDGLKTVAKPEHPKVKEGREAC